MHAVEMLHQVEARHGFVHRHFHITALSPALALVERRQHRMRGHQSAGLVGRNRGQIAGLARLALHEIGQATHALDHVVICRLPGIGAVFAKTVQAHIDEARVLLAQTVRIEPEPGQLLRAHAVHEHIGALQKRMQRGLRLLLLQIQYHAFLAAVGAHEHCRHARLQCRAGVARGVALRRLDLDHLGAVVGQHLAGHGAENHAGKVQYPHP